METRDGRKLLRTMSFISSRAKALRQRFVPTQRSMSDTWQNHTEGYMEDDPHLPSPDLGGSMLSLLNEQLTSWENDTEANNTGFVFRAQRSRSLDSLGSVPVTASSAISPPSTLKYQRGISSSAQDTSSMKIPRPTVSGLLIAGITDSISPSQPTSPIPKIPGPPPSPSRKSAPTTPRPIDPFNPHVSTSFVPKISGPPISPKPSRPSSPPVSRFGDLSTINCKVTAHRVSSNLVCPSTPNYSDSYYTESRTAQSLPVSPKYSSPTPRFLDASFFDSQIIPRIPAPPPSPKLFRPPGALSPATRSNSPKLHDNLHLLDNCSTGSSKEHTSAISAEISSRSTTPSTATTTSKPHVDSTAGESESFDHEETRDTITEAALPTRPTMFEMRPRPKLKHQWSMDETRTLSALAGSARQTSEAIGHNSCALKPAEKRRRFFLRKQTNSAPDSFDGALPLPPPKQKEHHSVSFCLGNVRRCRGSDSSILPPTLPAISKYHNVCVFVRVPTNDHRFEAALFKTKRVCVVHFYDILFCRGYGAK